MKEATLFSLALFLAMSSLFLCSCADHPLPPSTPASSRPRIQGRRYTIKAKAVREYTFSDLSSCCFDDRGYVCRRYKTLWKERGEGIRREGLGGLLPTSIVRKRHGSSRRKFAFTYKSSLPQSPTLSSMLAARDLRNVEGPW